jgi:trk system potassium uptake protein
VHVVIMGCGRVGAALAGALEGQGHSIAVIDRDLDSFRRIGADSQARQIQGIGFDRDTLCEAGIEQAGGFAAVSSGDNSNIIAARVARETFGVENVVARIYDPKRAEVYARLGIPTVATVRWTANQVVRRLLPQGALTEWRDPSGEVVLAEVHIAPDWWGRRATELEKEAGCRIAMLTRLGKGILTGRDTVLQEDDLVHVMVMSGELERVERLLAAGPLGSEAS